MLEHISLNGVIQAPGGPEEDTSGGFAHGGWISSYSDEILGTALRKQMNMPFDLLLGRKTFNMMIYPITLGSGKRLFADGTIPAAFKVTESQISSQGVMIVNYERAGAISTRSL